MKNLFAFSLALSALATSAAFAAPQSGVGSAQAGLSQRAAAQHEVHLPVAQISAEKSASGFKQALDSGVLVAETRSEFGSQYQRY